MEKKKVVVGMSGGVDSSVAAFLLKREGYEVVGVFMKNYSDAKNEFTGECSWREERRMARRVAAILDVPLLTIDYEKEYKKDVIEPMFRDYGKGLTPNPDILCNKIVKFPALWKVARKLKADFIATGHYVRTRKGRGGFELLRGLDNDKDQSYFLCELTQKDLSHSLFPVGELTKVEVRKIAKKNKFPNYDKKGTVGICFIGKTDMKKFLKKKIKEKRGRVLSPSGERIGFHRGMMFFTIGERVGEKKGFSIDNRYRRETKNAKLFVAEKRRGNVLVVVPEGHEILKRKKVLIKGMKFMGMEEKGKMKGRIRHLGSLESGKLGKVHGRWEFVFDKAQEGVAEGQFIVLYKGERVVGCGEIRL